MNSRERFFNRINRKAVDRIPNFCIIMQRCAEEYGIPYSEYVTDYKKLVYSQLKFVEKYGIDALCAISDPMREAEGFGQKVVIPTDAVPYAPKALVTDIYDLSNLKSKGYLDTPRMLDRVKAIELFKKEAGTDYPIIGWVEGAFAEACDIRGINDMMMDVISEEESDINALLDITNQSAIDFAVAQIDAGADIIGVGDAATSLISPVLYEKYALPHLIKLIDAIHDRGALVKLHICGNITKIIPYIVTAKPDILDVDWMVDVLGNVELLDKNNIAISGYYNPVDILSKDVEAIKAEIKKEAALMPNNYISAGGCEIPVHSPEKNMLAICEALKEIG